MFFVEVLSFPIFLQMTYLLFSKANVGQANKIMHIFNEFCRESGQSISAEKSKNFFSPHVP